MKKLVLSLLVSVLLVFVADAAFAVKLTVKNESGATVEALYISPDGENDWEEDILENDVLEVGDAVEIDLDTGGEDIGDILAVTEDGKQLAKYQVDFGKNNIITLRANGVSTNGEGAATARKPARKPSKAPARTPRRPSTST